MPGTSGRVSGIRLTWSCVAMRCSVASSRSSNLRARTSAVVS